MNIFSKFLQFFRRSSLYQFRLYYLQKRQVDKFNSLLDLMVADSQAEPYSVGLVVKNLKGKYSQRRSGPNHEPVVVAFGSDQDWEQYGLWPTFQRISHFSLWAYNKECARTTSKKSAVELRSRLAERFLKFIDKIETKKPVKCAFFYASGLYISNNIFRELSDRGIWSVIMGLDDKHQFFQNESHQMRIAQRCDLYWTTWKSGTKIILNIGGTPWYAPEAADPEFFHPIDIVKDIDILFIGQCYGHRVELIKYLRKRKFKVEAYGHGWPNGFVDYKKMIELFGRSKIVLGVGGVAGMKTVQHLKGRDFEVPMCGALYLTSYNHELADHFKIGKEILCYSSFEECAEIAHWVLDHPEDAENIRQAGLAKSLLNHTWQHRINQLFNVLNENCRIARQQ